MIVQEIVFKGVSLHFFPCETPDFLFLGMVFMLPFDIENGDQRIQKSECLMGRICILHRL